MASLPPLLAHPFPPAPNRKGSLTIQDIPVELLSGIFEHAANVGTYKEYYRRLQIIAGVYRFWGDVVKTSPELWRFVSAQVPPSGWTSALRLSRSKPIVVHGHSSRDPVNRDFLATVSPHIHRWERASLRIDRTATLATFAVLEHPAPQLKEFSLQAFSLRLQADQLLYLDLFAGVAPELSSLEISHVALRDWGSPILQGLASLSIVNVSRWGPSLEQMFAVLRACPALRDLELGSIAFSTDSAAPKSRKVELLRLRSLELQKLESAVVTKMLTTIVAPDCKKVTVHASDSAPDPALYDAATMFSSSIFQVFLASGGHVALTVGTPRYASFSMKAAHPTASSSRRLSVSLSLPHIAERPSVLRWGLNALSNSSTHVSAEVDFNDLRHPDVSDSIAILQGLPGITSIDFEECGGDDMTIIAHELSTPAVHPSTGARTWICPKLHSMSFRVGGFPFPVLLDLLAKRTEAAAADGIARLRHLEFYGDGMERKTFRRVKEILGPDADCMWESWNGSDLDPDGEEVESDASGESADYP